MRSVLVANRGEIAIRAFRAATELGIRTVAVYAREDRDALHRIKADEAYEIGEEGRPVRAYLDPDALIRVALEAEVDAIYPGYGFLSESTEFARKIAAAGLTFVGPPAEVLDLTGSKTRARDVAEKAGLPVLAASPLMTDTTDVKAYADAIGFPVFVKAAAGGGGRGMRRVDDPGELLNAVETAMREAEGAFGDPSVFLEQAMTRPRHIEVQVLADANGDVVHLFERDCSLQRRHQKVLEIAPAPNLNPDVRDQLCAQAVAFAKAVDYRNVGTVEFLVENADTANARAVFIEMNPRIQVEHTVTEEITDVDLVSSQLKIASGATLDDLGLSQDTITVRGAAIQARITTEDPEHGFRPDTGTISAYRSAGGAGIRLDAGNAFVGGEISPYFDSLLVKLTARGATMDMAIRRASRALAEFRVRGVTTNMKFLQALLREPAVRNGALHTTFIDENPQLLTPAATTNRVQRLAAFLAERTVNPEASTPPVGRDATVLLPDVADVTPEGSRDRLKRLGPEKFAAELRQQAAVAVTDTTLRDAHQSLFATRMRTYDMLAAAPVYRSQFADLLSLESWGGATYDVALRFLHEDPWRRLEQLREAVPNICLQMLLRGRNLLGYSQYPVKAVDAFVREAVDGGIDIFRVFDALNDVSQMTDAIKSVVDAGAIAEGTLCYSGDLTNPAETVYTLDHYLTVAEGVIDAGAQILCIKDMAGLLRAPAATTLVTALRERFDVPVHLHSHDTAGGQLATYLAAIDAGVDAIDCAQPPLSGSTAQPNMAALVAATDGTTRATGLSLDALWAFEPYWHAVRELYHPFEAGLKSPTGTVYEHEIPGGQLSNLKQQATALGLSGRMADIEEAYAAVNRLFGRIIKVTPTSKVVGDLALYLLSAGIDIAELEANPEKFDLPQSVLEFLHGELGTPHHGWPEPFRTKVLDAFKNRYTKPVAETIDGDVWDTPGVPRRRALDRLQFAGPTREFETARRNFWDVSLLPTETFFHGLSEEHDIAVSLRAGATVFFGLQAVSEPDERGNRTVLIRVNGQARPFDVRDRAIAIDTLTAVKADPNNPKHVAAPLTGVVSSVVDAGTAVTQGQPIVTIDAMKMESRVSAPADVTVQQVVAPVGTKVEPGDLLVVLG